MNIALVGMMGCGKSSAGRLVARRHKMRFADTDSLVEKLAGKSIMGIFAQKGEKEFRKLEKKAVSMASSMENTVIATGGGAVMDAGSLENLRKNSVLFYLKAAPKILAERVAGGSKRPRLGVSNKEKRLASLLNQRKRHYELSDFVVDAEGSPEETARQIAELLKFRGEITAVIAETTVQMAKKRIREASRLGADAVELRLDKLGTGGGEAAAVLVKLAKGLGLKCIATFRKKRGTTASQRIAVLTECLSFGADFVDLDASELKNAGRIPKRKIIASFHGFKATPSAARLEQLLAKMSRRAASVKFACKLRSAGDEKRLFALLEKAEAGGTGIAAFGVGENCRRSRVVASLKGSRLFYAHMGRKSAPGQYPLKEAVELRRSLS